jgi:hypothetical protein
VTPGASPTRPITEPEPTVVHDSAPEEPAPTRTPRAVRATAGIALAAGAEPLGSIEVLRGRTVALWPRAFADGVPVAIGSWRLVSGSADVLTRSTGTAAEPCEASWLTFAPGRAPWLLRFEVTSDALPGRVMTASIAVTVRSPALLH